MPDARQMPSPTLILHFTVTRSSYVVERGKETIAGISDQCTLNLRHYLPETRIKTISRQHFRIVYIDQEGFAVSDLHSLNGTSVNGWSLEPGVLRFLRQGDIITLAGNEEFDIEVVLDDSGVTEVFASTRSAGPAVQAETGIRYVAQDDQFIVDGVRMSYSHLTPIEHALLRYLCEHAPRVCLYDDLVRAVWGYAKYDVMQNNTVAKTISNLRRKLDELSAGAGDRYIVTVRGRGVMFDPR